MDETRILNNAIKHQGYVTVAFAVFDDWKKGNPLTNLDKAYSRLVPKCTEYVQPFLDKLIEQRLTSSAINR